MIGLQDWFCCRQYFRSGIANARNTSACFFNVGLVAYDWFHPYIILPLSSVLLGVLAVCEDTVWSAVTDSPDGYSSLLLCPGWRILRVSQLQTHCTTVLSAQSAAWALLLWSRCCTLFQVMPCALPKVLMGPLIYWIIAEVGNFECYRDLEF